MCNHCFKCGGSGHYSRGCRAESATSKGVAGKRPEVTSTGQGVTTQGTLSHNCANCKKREDVVPFDHCSSCKASRYCSQECQKEHWYAHRKLCKAIHKLEEQQQAMHHGPQTKNMFACHLTPRQQGKLTKLVGEKCTVNCTIQGKETEALWDTGAQVSVVSKTWQETHLLVQG